MFNYKYGRIWTLGGSFSRRLFHLVAVKLAVQVTNLVAVKLAVQVTEIF